MVRAAPQDSSKPATAVLPAISCPHEGHHRWWGRKGGLYFCKAKGDESRLVSNGQGIQRPLLQKPVHLVHNVHRDRHIGLKATPKDAPPNRLLDEVAAGRDPDPP